MVLAFLGPKTREDCGDCVRSFRKQGFHLNLYPIKFMSIKLTSANMTYQIIADIGKDIHPDKKHPTSDGPRWYYSTLTTLY